MKRHRTTVRGGRKRAFKSDAAYRLHLRSQLEAKGPDGPTLHRCAYYGSKAYKGPSERRPARGGKVHS